MALKTVIAGGLAALVLALGVGGCGGGGPSVSTPATSAAPGFDQQRAFADLRAQVELGPRPAGSAANRRQVAFIVRRLRAAGLAPVTVQSPERNVVAEIPGTGPGTVVVGAHHDTAPGIPGFVGANDGASGVAVLLELARALPRPLPGPSVTLAFFDGEEAGPGRSFEDDGTRGSRQFVRYARSGAQGTPHLGSIRAMYLLDMVGDCDLQIPREGFSDAGLYGRLEGPAFGGTTNAVEDDHLPFVAAGIPSVDLIDFTYGSGTTPGPYWHTARDTVAHVCASSLGQAGRAVAGALAAG